VSVPLKQNLRGIIAAGSFPGRMLLLEGTQNIDANQTKSPT